MSKQKTAVAKVLTRALAATEAEGASYPYDHIDVLIATAMLEPGERKWSDIAQTAGLTEAALRQRLLDPVRCRWLSMELEKGADTRMGMVIASVFAHAVRTGDPNRARLLLELFREKRPEKHLHLHAQLDLTQLSNEELTAFVKDRKRVLGVTEEASEDNPSRDGGGAPDLPADERGAEGGR